MLRRLVKVLVNGGAPCFGSAQRMSTMGVKESGAAARAAARASSQFQEEAPGACGHALDDTCAEHV